MALLAYVFTANLTKTYVTACTFMVRIHKEAVADFIIFLKILLACPTTGLRLKWQILISFNIRLSNHKFALANRI